MKKTYMKPEAMAIKIATSAIICLSKVEMSTESQGNSSALGRESNFWEEEY